MIAAMLLLAFGTLAAYVGYRVGSELHRFDALMWLHGRMMKKWKRTLDLPTPATDEERRERIALLRAHKTIGRLILREAEQWHEGER